MGKHATATRGLTHPTPPANPGRPQRPPPARAEQNAVIACAGIHRSPAAIFKGCTGVAMSRALLSRGGLLVRSSILRQLSTRNVQGPPYFAVVRVANEMATVPFVGTKDEADVIARRMESQKAQRVFVREVRRPFVPFGPYTSVDEIPLLPTQPGMLSSRSQLK